MRQEILAVILILLVAGSLGIGYLAGTNDRQTTTTTSTASLTTTQTSKGTETSTATQTITNTLTTTRTIMISPPQSNSSSGTGLDLQASINSTVLSTDQRLGITVSLFNSYTSALNVTTSNGWEVNGFPIALWAPLCYFGLPIEFMIVKGNYSVGQLQTASANSTVSYGCEEGGSVTGFLFRPMSEVAGLSGESCAEGCVPFHGLLATLNSTFTVNGYWAYPINSSEANDLYTPAPNVSCNYPPPCAVTFAYPEVGPIAQHSFTSGWYTFVVSDEWGQTVTLQFRVAS